MSTATEPLTAAKTCNKKLTYIGRKYNAKGQAVYMVAALGIVLDLETNNMRVFGGVETKMVAKNVADDSKFHMDDILSIDVSADRKPVVSGQVGKAPSVHFWDAETCESKGMFKLKEGARGVAAIAVSPCLRYVAVVDMHNDHHVVIYNIKRNKQLLHIEGSKEKIIHCAWSKKVDDLRFCTVGVKELKFWNPADATKRLFTKGTVGTKAKLTSFNSVAFDSEGTAFTSGTNGLIYIWDQTGQLDRTLKAHTAEISALCAENGKLISGGKDNRIVIYSAKGGEYAQEKVIDFETSYARSIDYFNGRILIGLRNGSIYEINEATEEKKHVMASHHEGEAWGLEVVPEDGIILTIGDDNKVMVFDYENKKFIRKGTISEKQPKN